MTAHLSAHPGVRSAPQTGAGQYRKVGDSKKQFLALRAGIRAPTFNLLPIPLDFGVTQHHCHIKRPMHAYVMYR